MTCGDGQADNQYKLALGDSLPYMRQYAADCGDALTAVVTAMDNGAWESETATGFRADLTGHKSASGTAGGDYADAFEAKWNNEEDCVPEDSSKAHWVPPH